MARDIKIPGLPDDLFDDTPLEEQEVTVFVEKRRYGKSMTVIQGFDPKTVDVKGLASKLKERVASGGTGKDDHIELQGDHRRRVKEELEKMGFRVKDA